MYVFILDREMYIRYAQEEVIFYLYFKCDSLHGFYFVKLKGVKKFETAFGTHIF